MFERLKIIVACAWMRCGAQALRQFAVAVLLCLSIWGTEALAQSSTRSVEQILPQHTQPLAPQYAPAPRGAPSQGVTYGVPMLSGSLGCDGGETCEEPLLLSPHAMLAEVKYMLWPDWLRHSSTDGRSIGYGGPLQTTSWLNRPFHVGWFLGTMWGNDVLSGQVGQKNTLFGGYTIGLDFDHYWGTQLRLAWASPELTNLTQPTYNRHGRLALFDADILYYPWGDSRIRPFVLLGIGASRFDIRDEFGTRQVDTQLTLPIGIGLKHHFRRWMTWHVGLTNNLLVSNGDFNTMHNVSFTIGVDIHWGIHPKSYYPWNPSRHMR